MHERFTNKRAKIIESHKVMLQTKILLFEVSVRATSQEFL